MSGAEKCMEEEKREKGTWEEPLYTKVYKLEAYGVSYFIPVYCARHSMLFCYTLFK